MIGGHHPARRINTTETRSARVRAESAPACGGDAYWEAEAFSPRLPLRAKAVRHMDSGLILLVFLALLFAWGVNRVRRFFRLSPVGYAGLMITFIIVMLAVWGQTMR
ncbi:hypothetical protein SAMN04489764_2255 [Thermostaphylospora chromogena]|uniref:Uncharacterized protein n=2 Tax=Thermostaphylospora chromogena TaxID=35622 RepID=A0A1H1E0A4_9ACTN|nr:hypothetical protein SAMN04489764_2255 [Thermostaphylospora chromogena]